jgi:hypothetical protein
MLFAGAFLSLVLILESILLYVNAFPKDTETTISYVFVFLYTFAVDIALWAGPMIFMLRLLPNEYLAIGIGVTQSILHFCTEILRLNELSFLSSSLFISAGVTICLTLLSLKLFPRAISLKVGGNAEIDRKVLGVDMQNSETLN